MLEWFRHLFRTWRARWNGKADGRRLIPPADASASPPFITYLCEVASWQMEQRELWFRKRDKALHPRYWHLRVLWVQTRAELELSQQAEEQARQKRLERPTATNIKAFTRAQRRTARARRSVYRAQQRMERARARRETLFRSVQADCQVIMKRTYQLVQTYVAWNMRLREDDRTPPAFDSAHLPKLEMPEALRSLDWGAPPPPGGRSLPAESTWMP